MAEPLKPLLLCADDYGLSPGVDGAIEALVRSRRLNAFSCLANGAHWARSGRRVQALRGWAQAGLHLNLTEGRPLSAALAAHWPELPPLPRLLADAHLGRLPLAALRDELSAQVAVYEQVAGAAPDYIDGHQHVHHFPGIRPLVLAWATARRVPVRNTGRIGGPGWLAKRLVLAGTGGGALARALRRGGLPHNAQLLGVYDFGPRDYRVLFRAWLRQVTDEGALLFCHPGQPGTVPPGTPPDPIAAARSREYAYLAGEHLMPDLAEAGVGLGPAWLRTVPV